jgi:RNA polymerase sigma-70 factor, ECF subfamily
MKPDDSARVVPPNDDAARPVDLAEYFDRGRLADLQRFVRSQCMDPELAEEVVQDTLIVTLGAWDKVGTFNNPMGWIVNAARKILKRGFRRAAVQRARTQGLEIVINEATHEPINDADAEMVLFSLMSKLSPRQKEVFGLFLDGFTDQEIALLLEITPSTVQSHREEARRRLQATMDEALAASRGGRNED